MNLEPLAAPVAPADRSSFKIPERRWMSVSFTDLRGFTPLTERRPPEEVREILNEYLERVIDAILKNKATVDKLVGDEAMALYGAPGEMRHHAVCAVKSALDQQRAVKTWCAEIKKKGLAIEGCGVGIATGDMVVGNVGGPRVSQYTALGHTVNLASRLCSVSAAGQILLPESSWQSIREELPEGWVVEESASRPGVIHTTHPERGKSEDREAFTDERASRRFQVGPKGSPCWEFRYLFKLKLKGISEWVPVLEVESLRETHPIDLDKSRSPGRPREMIVGRYRLQTCVSRSSVSEVWQARDLFGNRCAVKILKPELAASSESRLSFLREAEMMEKLQHPQICRIYEHGEYENHLYIAMEWISGVGPSAVRPSLPFPEKKALAVIRDVLSALHHLHQKGLVHGQLDLKNLMLRENGEPVLIDFQGVRLMSDSHEKDDLFATGKLLQLFLFGSTPITKPIPRDLRAILDKATSGDPDARYSSALSFRMDLERYERDEPVQARNGGLIYRAGKKLNKYPGTVSATALSVVALTLFWIFWFGERAKDAIVWKHTRALTFSQPHESWKQDWIVQVPVGSEMTTLDSIPEQRYRQQGRVLLADQASMSSLVWSRDLPGNLRVDWVVTAKRFPLNFNAFLGGHNRLDAYTFRIGGWDQPDFCLVSRGRNPILTARLARPLKVGKKTKLRMERENGTIRFFVDGRRIFQFQDPDPLPGDRFGLENHNQNILEFERIDIFRQAPPERVSAMSVPDRSYFRKDYTSALTDYLEIADTHPATQMAAPSLYRAALSARNLGNKTLALEILERLARKYPDAAILPWAERERIALFFEIGRSEEARIRTRQLAREHRGHEALRSVYLLLDREATREISPEWILEARLSQATDRHDTQAPHTLLFSQISNGVRELQLWEKTLGIDMKEAIRTLGPNPNLGYYAWTCYLLLSFGESRLALTLFRGYPEAEATALMKLGRHGEVFKMNRYSSRHGWSLLDQGRHPEVLEHFPWLAPQVFMKLGKTSEALREAGYPKNLLAESYYLSGEDERLIREMPEEEDWWVVAMLRENRTGEVKKRLASSVINRNLFLSAERQEALMTFLSGNQTTGLRQMDLLDREWINHASYWHYNTLYLLHPWLRLCAGDKAGFIRGIERMKEKCAQTDAGRRRAMASYLLKEIDDQEFLSQAYQGYIQADLLLVQGIRAESDGLKGPAASFYRMHLELPPHLRPREPAIDLLLRQRLQVLGSWPPKI